MCGVEESGDVLFELRISLIPRPNGLLGYLATWFCLGAEGKNSHLGFDERKLLIFETNFTNICLIFEVGVFGVLVGLIDDGDLEVTLNNLHSIHLVE